MPRRKSSMRKIREVLRLHHLGLSGRQIARSLRMGQSTVAEYLGRARVAKLSWPLPENLDDAGLEKRLFVPREEYGAQRPLPDWSWVHRELRRKHVTLLLLWEEYKSEHPDGYQYSQFCELYHRWRRSIEVWMRQRREERTVVC